MIENFTYTLQLGPKLGGDQYGTVYELDNFRVLRLISMKQIPTGDRARQQIMDRATRLARIHHPNVATPIDWGELEDDAVYLVERRLPNCLVHQLKFREGLAEPTSWLLDLLDGLGSLHSRKICHGDVRPENIFLDATENGSQSACLTDAAVGHLWWWTQGALISPSSSAYYPPEWAANVGEPTPQTDLYMLGVVACEMYLGKEKVKAARQAAVNGSDFFQAIQPRLKQVRVPREIRRLLGELLAQQSQDRPANAIAARARYKQGRQRRTLLNWSLLFLSIGGLLVAGLGGISRSSISERDRAIEQTTDAKKQRDQAIEEREQAEMERESAIVAAEATRNELTDVKAELAETRAELEERPSGDDQPSPPKPAPEELARDFWEEHAPVGADVRNQEEWQQFLRRAEERGDQQLAQRPFLAEWLKEVRTLRVEGQSWFEADSTLVAQYSKAAREPWKKELVAAASTRLQHLQSAGMQFIDWARNESLSFEEMEKLIDDPNRPAETNEILKAWHRQFLARSRQTGPQWTIQLKRSESPKGWGTRRQVSMQGSEWIDGEDHNWDKRRSHDYKKSEHGRISFSWHPNDPIGIILYGHRSYVSGRRLTLIDARELYHGPLSLWLFHISGSLTDERGFVLEFEIVDCPGPPKEVIRGMGG